MYLIRYVLCLVLIAVIKRVESISFYLKPGVKKCLNENLRAKVLVTGEYHVEDIPNQYVDYQVT